MKDPFLGKLKEAKAPIPDREGGYVLLLLSEVPQMEGALQEGHNVIIKAGRPGEPNLKTNPQEVNLTCK
eukprot:6057608-Amphidinium_carterae.1